jgi:TolB-like protein/DNA-binding winged helix-turn-helix (wHTH) protein
MIYKFGDVELDPSRFELRRSGRALKLERIPMELLILLVEREGRVVTRQEIVDRLWGKDVFVDTEHGINTAVRKIRQALSDDSEQPRFVQTVTGKGYRFVAQRNGDSPLSSESEAAQPAPSKEPEPISIPEPAQPSIRPSPSAAPPIDRSNWRKMRAAIAALILITIVVAGTWGGLNAGGVRDRWFAGSHARQIHSIAVIPLTNLSGDASQDYFADGMTDELITALAKNRNLRVVSRTSAMQYKGVKRPLPEIARELGVDGILEGSIERSPNRVHMTVQLIYAPTDSHVWADSYDRDLNQAYSLPAELSETIAKQVKSATSPASPQPYINPEAHDAYLRGRYFWFGFNVAETLPYFEKAIQLQPDYAAAWSGLADTYAIAGMTNRPALQAMPKVLEAARKAVELDDSLPDAHNSMAAWYLFYAWDLPRADAESRRAIELNPNYGEAHYVRHYVLMAMNRLPEAESEEKRAVELDPFARSWSLGQFFTDTRQYDAAINELRQQHMARPKDDAVAMLLSKVYWLKGMYKESQEALEDALRLENRPDLAAAGHRAWVRGGETAVEKWGVEQALAGARKGYVSNFDMAIPFAFAGDKQQTLKYLEAALRDHQPGLITVQYEGVFDFLHNEPRYRALVAKIGLQPAY